MLVCVCHNFICLNSHFADDCFIFGFRFNFQFSLEHSILNPYNDSFLIISSIRFWYSCKRNSFAIIDVIIATAIFSINGNSKCIYTFSFIDLLLECSDFDKFILSSIILFENFFKKNKTFSSKMMRKMLIFLQAIQVYDKSIYYLNDGWVFRMQAILMWLPLRCTR